MSVKIYKLTDRIEVKIDSVTFQLSPLSWGQKQEISSEAVITSGTKDENNRGATFKALKYAIKGISGVTYSDGSEYKLSFDDDGSLSQESIEELLNMEICTKLVIACYAMVQGVPNKIVNPVTGEPVEGVEVVKKKTKS